MDGDGELRLSLMATLAQEESRKTSERVKQVRKSVVIMVSFMAMEISSDMTGQETPMLSMRNKPRQSK